MSDSGPFKRPGRPIHKATADNGESERVLYSDTPPGRYRHCLVMLGIASCNPCLVSNAEKLRAETYVTVYENKIESSRPCQCWCCGFDRVDVIYFDRAETAAASKASCCYPFCTHCRFAPTCCDAFGEGVILYGGDMCSPRQSCTMSSCNGICFLCHCKMLWPVRNARELASVIIAARTRAMETMNRQKKVRSGFTREGHMSIGVVSKSDASMLNDVAKKLNRGSQRLSSRSSGSVRSQRSTDSLRKNRFSDDEDLEDQEEPEEESVSDSEINRRSRSSDRVSVEGLNPRSSHRIESRNSQRTSQRVDPKRTSQLRGKSGKPRDFVAVATPAPTFDYPAYAEDMLR
mmetsp:Transcript_18787/g.33332  ORF Transcript_18787/g.33332 Transcript_18787/m.33332 type:complete len:346 (-) Transcript_18787:102-1139(-)|eukprot:CAMPEP_0184525858 /NCGR_PEP_ID=MMETSP0198_2-20121128/10338_1 /TAXON_ID=1112570 /ORGANISM="Thraustochytrium sp., Strain LLF1b" /LENGTH=345 /DNA_ID=CAMNT_0026917377 /DNA_START=208 /DNA_END=1245 /DNA_ORIENTATION=+